MWQNILHNYSALYTPIFGRSAIEKIVGRKRDHMLQWKKWKKMKKWKKWKKKLTNRLNTVVDRTFTVFQTSHILHDIIGF